MSKNKTKHQNMKELEGAFVSHLATTTKRHLTVGTEVTIDPTANRILKTESNK